MSQDKDDEIFVAWVARNLRGSVFGSPVHAQAEDGKTRCGRTIHEHWKKDIRRHSQVSCKRCKAGLQSDLNEL